MSFATGCCAGASPAGVMLCVRGKPLLPRSPFPVLPGSPPPFPVFPPVFFLSLCSRGDFVYGAFTHPQLVQPGTVSFTSSFYTAYEVFTAAMPTPSGP